MPLKPVSGRTVKIEVPDGSEARAAFGALTELTDQGNATAREQYVSAGEPGIFEIEIYARPANHP